ncbi:helix-turn-helix transcriptional regulator [Streptomyces cylindrosporus]|uniref:Helix-turn-helix transcriptional regulator n=1 Tax=Streptomyces cylindrosporus TaxID=2927583 RepID=A0ABS9YGJ3_9ACTN|nr:helix-turn-helix transcriptional regulator [Streptomyces cylindrosporus]MCI3274996.1 helix-turn-helix transcriptional regulator [Streptomyces cylindrosporus]
MTAAAHRHDPEELCEAGLGLYARALREGRIHARDTAEAPCLVDLGFLSPVLDDTDLMEPMDPALALHRLLRASGERVAHERRREQRMTEAFEPLLRLGGLRSTPAEDPAIRLLAGMTSINTALAAAMAEATEEALCIQPHSSHIGKPASVHTEPLVRDQALLDRGGRIRTLYQHTLRHAPTVVARYERLRGDVEARTLDEVTERLVILDRTVAFIPANADRTLALEVRHPALVGYLATAFDRLWRLATPMHPQSVRQPTLNGVTPRQRAIAALLVEGHTDAVIADRLGMNIRTARVHIAKLAATLGSDSRAQLGYLIGQSGILKQDH